MYLTRHTDMIKDVNLKQQIVVVGAGSIGSYATLALAKLGFSNIIVIDDGSVDEENIAPQFYRPRDLGKKKVLCLKTQIKEHTGIDILALDMKYEESTKVSIEALYESGTEPLIVVAVDSMGARKWIHQEADWWALVDARMAIEFLAVYSITQAMDAHSKYGTTLYSDADSVQEACTNKAISYTSFIAGGLVAKCVLDRCSKAVPDFQVVNFDINQFDMVRL